MRKKNKVPEPTIARLPKYYGCLIEFNNNDVAIVSSEEISSRAGVKASQFRKDMSYFGEFGIQGLGYPVSHLMEKISLILNLDKPHSLALIGVGNLGSALAKYSGFINWNFKIKYLFDKDDKKIGTSINGIKIEDIKNLPKPIDAYMGVISVPREFAQETSDLLIKSGIRAILNFTPAYVRVPFGIVVRNVDLTHELAILSYYMISKNK